MHSQRSASAVLLLSTLAASCTSTQPGPAPSPQIYQPAGWFDVQQSLQGESFGDYINEVRQRLKTARLPLDPLQADIELDRSAPVQLDPVSGCGETVRGIVLLVHGLSDTAYAMRDMARYFASRCHIARTVLLPGHGTRAGDLLIVDHDDWTNTIRYLVKQAAREHEHITLVGFSLGAVVSTTVALDEDSPVDAIVAISPAYGIGQWRLARLTPYLHRFHTWIDRGPTADALRYEAMPTKGIAELVRSRRALQKRLAKMRRVKQPWLLVQSLDDATIAPKRNREFVLDHGHAAQVLEYYSEPPQEIKDNRVERIPSRFNEPRVDALSHASVHIAPDNPHYGIDGEYRICGTVDGRHLGDALRCEAADKVFYTVWAKLPDARPAPAALSSFNPHFDKLMITMDRFIEQTY